MGAVFGALGLLGSAAALWYYGYCFSLQSGVGDQTSATLAGAGFPAASLILFFIIWLVLQKRSNAARGGQETERTEWDGEAERKPAVWSITEGILFICLIAAGTALRILNMQYAGESAAYYDAAMVTEGGSLPQVAHGAAYFYIQLLHLLFLLLGNKWIAGIWLQIILQTAGCILMYLAVRRISGAAAALVLAAFMMLTPGEVLAGLTYSPDMLYLCIYAVGLLCVASFLKKRAAGKMKTIYDVILLVFAGAWVALACYLDLMGITLLLFIFSAAGLYVRKSHFLWENTALGIAVFVLSAVVFFAAYLGLDAYASGKSFAGVLHAWKELYQVKGYDVWFWYGQYHQTEVMILLFFMIWAALGYFCSKKSQNITPWICMTAVTCAMGCFQMDTPNMGYFGMLCYFSACLAGAGIAACFHVGEYGGEKQEQEDEAVSAKDFAFAANQPEEEIDMQSEQALSEKETEYEELPQKPVKLIENPLPLPKKHARRIPDYGFIPDESQMKYDIEVDERDDFDI